jgi:hypothetical protein
VLTKLPYLSLAVKIIWLAAHFHHFSVPADILGVGNHQICFFNQTWQPTGYITILYLGSTCFECILSLAHHFFGADGLPHPASGKGVHLGAGCESRTVQSERHTPSMMTDMKIVWRYDLVKVFEHISCKTWGNISCPLTHVAALP